VSNLFKTLIIVCSMCFAVGCDERGPRGEETSIGGDIINGMRR